MQSGHSTSTALWLTGNNRPYQGSLVLASAIVQIITVTDYLQIHWCIPIYTFCTKTGPIFEKINNCSSTFYSLWKTEKGALHLEEIKLSAHCCDWLTSLHFIHTLLFSMLCFDTRNGKPCDRDIYVWAQVRSWGRRNWNKAATMTTTVCFRLLLA